MQICYSGTKLICGCLKEGMPKVAVEEDYSGMRKLLVLMDVFIILNVFVVSWTCILFDSQEQIILKH